MRLARRDRAGSAATSSLRRPDCKLKRACATVLSWFFPYASPREASLLRDTEHGWSHRLAWPRTEPSQGLNTGSNPVGTTTVSPLLDSGLTVYKKKQNVPVPLS